MIDEGALNRVARQAAQETMRETFRLFGVDVYDQDAVNALRSDLMFARHLRKANDTSKRVALGLIVTAALWGVYNVFVEGAKSLAGKFH